MRPAPNRRALTTRKETMSGIWRSPKLKPKAATPSEQKTTTSTPYIISDRCPRTEERHRRLCYNGRLFLLPCRMVALGGHRFSGATGPHGARRDLPVQERP